MRKTRSVVELVSRWVREEEAEEEGSRNSRLVGWFRSLARLGCYYRRQVRTLRLFHGGKQPSGRSVRGAKHRATLGQLGWYLTNRPASQVIPADNHVRHSIFIQDSRLQQFPTALRGREEPEWDASHSCAIYPCQKRVAGTKDDVNQTFIVTSGDVTFPDFSSKGLIHSSKSP